VNPNLIHFGLLSIPTFGVLAAIGLMASLTLSVRTAVWIGLDKDRVWDAGLFAIVAAFVLSRLLLVVTNLKSFMAYPILLLMVPSLTPLGLLLTILCVLVYFRVRGLPMLATLDAWAPCGALTWAFLALGHFAEGSDPGMPSRLPWAMTVIPDGVRVHPVGIYSAIAAAIITIVLYRFLRRRHRDGDAFGLCLALCGVVQFLLTFVREPAFFDNTLGNLLDPIQWVALGMMMIGAVVWLQPRKLVTHAV
jgi:phosphatidylglycerol:prolipoprotein diacylglycerol transferase